MEGGDEDFQRMQLPKSTSLPSSSSDLNSVCTVQEQDRHMPMANVIRIMRKVLPTRAKISDDAKQTTPKCVSEFISFITSEANERCHREERTTITAEDVLWAMDKLGFHDYTEPLALYLQRYRDRGYEGKGSTIRGDPFMNPVYAPAFGPDPGYFTTGGAGPGAGTGGAPPQMNDYFRNGHGAPPQMNDYSRDGDGANQAQVQPDMAFYDPYAPNK